MNGQCFTLKGEVRPLTAVDATELDRLYAAIRESLSMNNCETVEVGGTLIAKCTYSTNSSGENETFLKEGSLIAVWLEPPSFGQEGIETVLGFIIEASRADDVIRGFRVLSQAIDSLRPLKFLVRLSR